MRAGLTEYQSPFRLHISIKLEWKFTHTKLIEMVPAQSQTRHQLKFNDDNSEGQSIDILCIIIAHRKTVTLNKWQWAKVSIRSQSNKIPSQNLLNSLISKQRSNSNEKYDFKHLVFLFQRYIAGRPRNTSSRDYDEITG